MALLVYLKEGITLNHSGFLDCTCIVFRIQLTKHV